MKLGRYNFSPPWWGVLLCLIAMVVFSALGVWQLNRAQFKEQLQSEIRAAQAAGLQVMSADEALASANGGSPQLDYGHRYSVTGRYDEAKQILLNDQVRGRRNGYRVWTPLVLENGARVIVDRGWIPRPDPASKRRPSPPAPNEVVRVQGIWRQFPQPGLSFGMSSYDCNGGSWPRAMNTPKATTVACQYDTPVARGLLLLDASEPGGFVRDWNQENVGLSPFGHYAYAVQWFLGAVVAVVIFLIVNLKRRSRSKA